MSEKQRTKKPLWIKDVGGGTFRLQNGYRVKPEERFRAKEDEIPLGARDLVHRMDEVNGVNTPQEKEKKETPQAKGQFKLERKGGPYWNIVSPEGTVMNDKGMKYEEAEDYKDQLNSNNG